MQTSIVIGIDLSGPRNLADTCVVAFEPRAGSLFLEKAILGAGDRQIYDLVSNIGSRHAAVVGIDAPLSYNPAGGDRPSDKELRGLVHAKGRTGVMPPTLIRMVYLTLRGIALTRELERLRPRVALQIVEVHPGASMLLHGAAPADVAAFKREESARVRLLDWLQGMGMNGLSKDSEPSDHFVAACAAALGAWRWSIGRAAWCHPAQPPEHPYDFAC